MTSSIEAVRAALAKYDAVLKSPTTTTNECVAAMKRFEKSILPMDVEYVLATLEAAILERDELRGDAERFAWWFSWDAKPTDFVNTYLQGMRERWSLDQWRAAVDAARSTPQHPTKD